MLGGFFHGLVGLGKRATKDSRSNLPRATQRVVQHPFAHVLPRDARANWLRVFLKEEKKATEKRAEQEKSPCEWNCFAELHGKKEKRKSEKKNDALERKEKLQLSRWHKLLATPSEVSRKTTLCFSPVLRTHTPVMYEQLGRIDSPSLAKENPEIRRAHYVRFFSRGSKRGK